MTSTLTVPGFVDDHSHAFHRALRGRAQTGRGSFWTWREQMYDVASRLNPDRYLALTRATYRELLSAGYTSVTEFHYLHHPGEMGDAVTQAAAEAGIRLTLLDTCYLSSGFGAPPTGVQRRFSDGTAAAWAERAGPGPAAIHSVRAVPRDQLHVFRGRDPLHVHLSEQPRENEECLAAYGVTPTRLLHDEGVLGPGTTVVHATHLTDDDIALLGSTATNVCLTPTTEQDLADGIGPARRLYDAGCRLTIGSDSHAVIDPFEELRALEGHERLRSGVRGHWTAAELLDIGTGGGMGGETGKDLVTIDAGSPRTAGTGGGAETVVFAATAADVVQVEVGGRVVYTTDDDDAIGRELEAAIGALWRDLITGIGELTTHDADQPIRRDAALVVDDGRIAWVGRAADAPAADERVDVGGRAVLPGFVDSHSHLVFAGDRTAEFEARMSGASYAAGGIMITVAATRAASDEALRSNLARLLDEMARQGTTTVEVKSGYGLTAADEARSLRLAREVTEETTYLGAHVVPTEWRDDPSGYVDLVTGPMLAAAAPHARWVDAFCERGAFDADQARAVLTAGAAAGLRGRLHANQLGPGPGVRLACELGLTAVDHCTHLDDADVDALSQSGTIATLLPGVEFSTRQPYPDGRRLLAAGVRLALATDCNPGSCYTSSMPLCIALAVREMGLTPTEAVYAATAGGAAALDRADVGRLPVGSRADLVVLDAPSHVHLAYRPGVPLVAEVWRAGRQVSRR